MARPVLPLNGSYLKVSTEIADTKKAGEAVAYAILVPKKQPVIY